MSDASLNIEDWRLSTATGGDGFTLGQVGELVSGSRVTSVSSERTKLGPDNQTDSQLKVGSRVAAGGGSERSTRRRPENILQGMSLEGPRRLRSVGGLIFGTLSDEARQTEEKLSRKTVRQLIQKPEHRSKD